MTRKTLPPTTPPPTAICKICWMPIYADESAFKNRNDQYTHERCQDGPQPRPPNMGKPPEGSIGQIVHRSDALWMPK